jgi:hypothetical protein
MLASLCVLPTCRSLSPGTKRGQIWSSRTNYCNTWWHWHLTKKNIEYQKNFTPSPSLPKICALPLLTQIPKLIFNSSKSIPQNSSLLD